MQSFPGKFQRVHAFRPVFYLLAASFIFANIPSASADNGWEGQIVSLTWENDAVAGTDRHYTHGTMISYFSRDDALPRWTEKLSSYLPSLGFDVDAQKYGFALGQQIYTPDNLDAPGIIQNDRPYAAWLYGRVALQRRGSGAGSSLALETLALDLGVIGPEALGEEAQNVLHEDGPQGWPNQLDTEPAFALRYLRRHLYEARLDEHWRVHLIPHVDASAGTVDTHLGGGGTVRFGYNVPNEFETPGAPTAPKFGGYVFSGFDLRWVVRNIFLDGNTFQSSHSVDREPLVRELRVGVGLILKRVEIIVGHTFLTDEFEEQQTDDSYSFATLLFKF